MLLSHFKKLIFLQPPRTCGVVIAIILECTFYFHYPEVEEVSPVKKLKGLAAVLQHIAEKDDDMDAITYTLNSPTKNRKRNNFLSFT